MIDIVAVGFTLFVFLISYALGYYHAWDTAKEIRR